MAALRGGIFCAWLVTQLGLLLPARAAADASCADLRQRVLAYVRAETGQPAARFLRAIRREDLEEDVFNRQLKIPGRIKKTVEVFEVTDTGWEIISPSEAQLHTSTAPGKWIVAAGVDDGPFFGLRGFERAESNFNALAGFARVELRSQAEALSWAELYNLLVLSEEYGSVVTSPKDLRNEVEDIEEAYRQSRDKPFLSSAWLRGLSRQRLQYGIDVAPSPRGYAISLDSLSISSDRHRTPVLRRIRMALTRDGAFTDKVVEALPALSTRQH